MKAHYLVCFDISDDKVRTRVGKRLLRHGDRVQESVFEVALASRAEFERLLRDVRKLLEDEQELRFYRLCRDCRKASMRVDGAPVAAFPAVVII